MAQQDYPASCRKWDVFEIQLDGPQGGNPFADQWLQGIFTSENESVSVQGFYDGDGVYRIRFMPSFEGRYTFVLHASFLQGPLSGAFHVEQAEDANHGIVRTNGYHFTYEDGSRYVPNGTTCYVWDLQSEEEIQKTLDSLSSASFNKVRFCIFPKHYVYNLNEPASYPYAGTPVDSSFLTEDNWMDYLAKDNGSNFDHTRFNPAFFQHLEKCVGELAKRGIEADLILFHPYDRWGFSTMSREDNAFYLKYVIARLSSYHNVWWSLANEWDLNTAKTVEDWEYLASVIVKNDRYHHLRSIHNCRQMYDGTRPWITHISAQRIDLYKSGEITDDLRTRYGKPVIMDELGYEGDLPYGWGNLTGEELTRRAWETAVRGGYPGHGETFLSRDNRLWWSHGGTLKGDSAARFAFLHQILSEVKGSGLAPLHEEWDAVEAVREEEVLSPKRSYYLFYYSFMRPSYRVFHLDSDTSYVVEIIDTWNMTIEKAGIYRGTFRVALPAKPYIAVRIHKAEDEDFRQEEPEEEEVVTPEVVPEEPVSEETDLSSAETQQLNTTVIKEAAKEMAEDTAAKEEKEPVEPGEETEILETPVHEETENTADYIQPSEVENPEPVSTISDERIPKHAPKGTYRNEDGEIEVPEESEAEAEEDLTGGIELSDSPLQEPSEPAPEGGIVFGEDPLGKTTVTSIDDVLDAADEAEEFDFETKKEEVQEDTDTQTLNIPPVNFSHSINDPPKRK
jgi:hypothetical protein